jgi:hypothetical protein
MFIEPESGEVEPFGEFEVRVVCRSRITYKDRIFTKNFALLSQEEEGPITSMKNSHDFKPETIHEYSALMSIEEDDPIILQLKANAVCPAIKLSESMFKFGDCSLR